ncbi:MAG: hypothetical protein IJZ39_00335 [Oscillospiraceae bacterium]|nr:hypothetical protein [Oscillospiraceae bacterium]
MAGMVVLGTFAAFGALCALWLLAGILLPGERDGVMVCCWRDSASGRGVVIRWRIQWELGLLRGRLAVIDLGLTEEDRVFLARWGRNVEIWERD